MARLLLLFLPGLVAICAVRGIFMDRLASRKLCADDECVYTISLARAQEDYSAPDCRFINVKKGQWIYVYSKLVKENEAGEFWAGSVRRDYLKYIHILTYVALNISSVYGDQPEDEMGTVGYFPSNLVQEQHVYQEATKEVPTMVSISGGAREGLRSQGNVDVGRCE
ncbi:hypothetical protein E2I00_017613 [Balaenoptera physalus]|uniref:SH3 domain-containing protein n=1 Tax=Balaenoptera physalus TaxID=9770 RepID=A0A6A1Q291_BALPH|nr:hypothetical protein E2I00_017613 [Balaenoptera physalus]